jgi:hypothetical protein
MIVICTRVPPTPTGEVSNASAWVTVDGVYQVVSVLAEPDRQVQLQIMTDDGCSLAWFDSANFMTVDGTMPERWTARISEGGVFELGPPALLAPGFWESYYDGDPSAADVVEAEVQALK